MKCMLVALLAIAAIALVQANTCGGNCPSNDCASCPCGTSRAPVDIGSWCSKFSGWSQSQCRCIVSHESGGNAHAANQNVGGSFDIGVWQVNSMNWRDCSGGKAPCDPSVNLGCAIDVWRWGGGTFKLWSTCGGCGACAVSGVNAEWDGSYPEGYDASRPFPYWAREFAVNDTRIDEW